jgi:probable rRNA maturation factor
VKASPPSGVFVQYRAGRKGVPSPRSFERWVREALRGHRKGRRQVNIVLFDESGARELNRQYRGKNYPTNVLSWPYVPAPREKSGLLGDLAICAAVVAREAADQGKTLRDHYAHLTVHGVLHLLGYDHQTPRQADRMERLERRILAELGVPDPYV